ncbi:MAG: hypothetical protein CBC42_01495 [Betaproteobacteria bacterium TMED82]|nr:MAG: hypothetical protein CBC42_01495 [Betaproteobacteria bacterium TMED82]|tara:strand:- start:33487 stop:33891 length:405 start_codon:yes stop_codon:yes gene_type:complete
MVYIYAYLGTFVTFALMDAFWLGLIATDFYYDHLDGLLRKEPNWAAALIFYTGYIAGLVYFAIRPSLTSGNFKSVLRDGALLGLLSYATYDMTNLATLINWPITITIIDIIWGIFITSISSVVGYLCAKFFQQI